MAILQALIEGCSIFIAVCATLLIWTRSELIHGISIAVVLEPALVLSLCCLVAFYYNSLYDFRIVRNFTEFVSRFLRSMGVALILLAVIYISFPEIRIPAGPFVASLLVMVGLLLPLRMICYRMMRSRLVIKRALILGTGPVARELIEAFEAQPHFGYTAVGVVGNRLASQEHPLHSPFLGPPEQLSRIIEEVHPDRIIVALADWQKLPVRQLLESRICGITVEDGVEVYERLTGKLAIESLAPISLIFFPRDFHKLRFQMALRRAFSLVSASIGLILTAPLQVLIAVAIKLDSKGPVFFIQERAGLQGRTFRLLKFRTMHQANGKTSEWAGDNGHRITCVGKWLRRFRLDELPQFVNILRGDMDLVGPRPHPKSNYALLVMVLRNAPECGEAIPYYAIRSLVRPGITGWAQVRYGYANNLEEEIEKVRYDLYYIKHMSFWLDLRILLDTIKIALLGRESGAAGTYRTETSMGMSTR